MDALAVSGPAAATSTPVLLVRQDRVPNVTAEALEGYTSTVAVGGTDAISEEVLDQLPDAERLAGADRWTTATTIADHYVGEGLDATSVAVSSGADANLVDALPGGTLGQVVLLSRTTSLPQATTSWLEGSEVTEHVFLLGGETAVAESVMDALRALVSPWAP